MKDDDAYDRLTHKERAQIKSGPRCAHLKQTWSSKDGKWICKECKKVLG